MSKNVARFGQWESPLSSEQLTKAGSSLLDSGIGENEVWWLETRPDEHGRYVLVVESADGERTELPPAYNVRSRVHEYGGGAWCRVEDSFVFVNFLDQALYWWSPGQQPEVIHRVEGLRYADLNWDSGRDRLLCVREDHRRAGEPVNELVALQLSEERREVLRETVLVSGHDFFASPVLSADGGKLAWLAWDHPNMPWDNTELHVAELDEGGKLTGAVAVAGGHEEAIFQPTWTSAGELVFVSDRSNWWNLYAWDGNSVRSLWRVEAEVGVPMWVFGIRRYALLDDHSALVIYDQDGLGHLAHVDWSDDEVTVREVQTKHTFWSQVRVHGSRAVVLAGAATAPIEMLEVAVPTLTSRVVVSPTESPLTEPWISRARPISFTTADGNEVAHALYYPPTNPEFDAPEGDLPPLIVMSHGGPTSSASSVFRLSIQFWTSRGFAVADVNYRGSSGYGRAYRDRLKGHWGQFDVDDCVAAAEYLVDSGAADPNKLAIRGGSAGGYTTLAALTFRDTFSVGASYYGVSDLEALTKDTHKFESRYLDSLVAPYPEGRNAYVERSPIHHVEQLDRPVIFLQGAEDEVVPPDQAEKMVRALREKKLPVAYLLFPGEQHGFRGAHAIEAALDAELSFYLQMFGLEPAEDLEPIEIDNWPPEE